MWELIVRFGYRTDMITDDDDFNKFLKNLDAYIKKLLPKNTNPLDYIDDVNNLFVDLSDSGLIHYLDDIIPFYSLPSLSIWTHTETSSIPS